MQTCEIGDYRLTLSEMSRRSQVALSTWFNEWLTGPSKHLDKIQRLSAISTQVILHSRINLYRDGEKLSNGTYDLGEDAKITLPLTEACLNDDLPASLVLWMVDAAGKENSATLEGFLAGTRVIQQSMTRSLARLSDSGPSSKSTPA
jgi:hypothetical protein